MSAGLVVDGHSHLYPREYLERLARRDRIPRLVAAGGEERIRFFAHEDAPGGSGGRPIDEAYWDVGAKLRWMAAAGIDQSVVSLGNPWLDFFEGDDAIEAAGTLNALLGGLQEQTGGRLVGMGVLPQTGVEAAVQAAREIASTPTLYGIANGSRVCGLLLDDERLDPLWEVLDASGLPLVVHPHHGVPAPEVGTYDLIVGFPFETTMALTRLVLGGVLERFGGVRIVAVHGGGALPYLAGRLDAFWAVDPGMRARLPLPPSHYVAKLAVDAVLYAPAPMRAAAAAVGPERLLFGTDHPFSVADPAGGLAAIAHAFDPLEAASVRGAAAAAYFGLPPVAVGV
jgi:aminocarboxymuconate-semialdehyde decarboxylase